ncbi:MAG: hypothetical protein ACLQHF_15445 [Terracidiphilus sp.]
MRKTLCVVLALVAVSPAAFALTSSTADPSSSSSTASSSAAAQESSPANPPAVALKTYDTTPAPFSRLALAGGIGAGGINLQAAANVNRYINLRMVGNVFNYTVSNVNTNGLTLNGKLNLASAGLSVDLYPFPYHGLRFSPGVLFYNQNSANATVTVSGGTSFKLNDIEYYSSPAAPVQGAGSLGLNAQNPAFTMTAGWGNLISRRGGHFSIPFEIGAAFVGTPKLNLALTSGQVCSNPQGTEGCQDIATDTDVQSNLQSQISKYQNDLSPLKVYPIISVGIGYNFKIR